MSQVKVLIVEDSLSYSLELEMMIKQLGYHHIGTVTNSGDALFEILDKNPDLIFMDIELSGKISGLDIAKRIEHLNIPIIFITSFANGECFNAAKEISNTTYIVKPVEKYSLMSAINLLFSKMIYIQSSSDHHVKGDSIFLKKKDNFVRIQIDEILLVEANRVYCKTITIDGLEFLNRISLNDYASLLSNFDFIKPHRSYLVNCKRVTSVNLNDNLLIIDRNLSVPISRSSKNDLKEHFNFVK